MGQEDSLLLKRLRAPRAAAIAGILFSILLITSQLIVWISIPADQGGPTTDVINHSRTISLSLNLLPFAGIAFLWFIAVIRNRLGVLEDRFFATILIGSGLLYIAMIFTSGALAAGLIRTLINAPEIVLRTGTYALGRAEIYQSMNVYGIKMAGVFMFSTSTILLRTEIVPRWIAFLGYALGGALLLSIGIIRWIPLVFPVWIFCSAPSCFLRNHIPNEFPIGSAESRAAARAMLEVQERGLRRLQIIIAARGHDARVRRTCVSGCGARLMTAL